MPFSPDLRLGLLNAIETDSLVFLCGAGLSMAAPSNLPSAVRVSRICYDQRSPVESLDPALRDDIDNLAALFHGRGDFSRVFVPLVPWNELLGLPNDGHAAIADLLITKGAHAALSANFDRMIETWGESHKVDLRGALTGQEAETFATLTRPLLKFHGCLDRDRDQTLWTHAQLTDPVIQHRIASCSQWMNLHLPGKHLVVIGFWSDWDYLNQVFADAFTINNARAVTVVDPSPSAQLEAKAPQLWDRLHGLSHRFEHVMESGADFLKELRLEYSKTWERRFYALGQPLLTATAAAGTPMALAAVAPTADLDVEELYDLRRDAEGVSYARAGKHKEPPASSAQAAFFRMLMLDNGATKYHSWLEFGHQRIRIINGAGQALETVQSTYVEPSTMPKPDVVVCAGAMRVNVPARIIPKGRGLSIVRPAAGVGPRWLTLDEARTEFTL